MSKYYNANRRCCKNCSYFDDNTHFCRLNPPIPVIFYDKETETSKTTSKFPVITLPEKDYCSFHEPNGNR